MDDFGIKQDDSAPPAGQFDASEANNELPELMNAVENSGQTLSIGDNFQLSKSMTNHTAVADFYSALGTNTYTLSPVGSFTGPTLYIDGMRVRSLIGNANTSTVVTVNVNSLGAKSVFNNGAAVAIGVFTGNCEMVYSASDDRFNLTKQGVDGTDTGTIESVSAGTNIAISGSESSPTLDLDSSITGVSVNGVTLGVVASTLNFLNGSGAYTTPSSTSADISTTTTEFLTSGTYIVPADVTMIRVICVGGGGGGGGSNNPSSSGFGAGGGGGSGGYCENTFDVVTSQSYAITVGSGGDGQAFNAGDNGTSSSVFLGASQRLLSNGGVGGGLAGGSTVTGIVTGGDGGTSTVFEGITNVLTGQPGLPGINVGLAPRSVSGNGGSNPVGAGGVGVSSAQSAGNDGVFGGGGSGGKAENLQPGQAGGDGGNGVVIIIAYKTS